VDTIALSEKVENKRQEKWDWSLDDGTLCASYASRNLARNAANRLVLPA
jgi:hypothetical protein